MFIDVLIIVIGLVSLLGFAWLMQRKMQDRDTVLFWIALLVKILAGVVLGWIYLEHYGTGDTIIFWQDGQVIAGHFYSDPAATAGFFWDESQYPGITVLLQSQAPRSLFFVKIAAVFAALSGGNYWMMGIMASFISFIASWYLFERTNEFFPNTKRAGAIAFLFWPSIVFWSSGLVKESMGMASLFFLAGILLKIIFLRRVYLWEWLIAALSLWIGWNLKYYWMGIFLPVALSLLIVTAMGQLRAGIRKFETSFFFGSFLLLLILVTSLHPNFYPHRIFEVMKESNGLFIKLSNGQNAIQFPDLNASGISMLANSPRALVGGLFRPFPWEAYNFLSFCAGLENLILIIITVMCFPAIRRIIGAPYRTLTMATLLYSTVLAIFLALSAPNFGTLSRYRIGFLPFLVYLLLSQNQFLSRGK